MFHKKQAFYCLICKSRMSYFNKEESEIEQCPKSDCGVTWQYKKSEDRFIAIDWPGKKVHQKRPYCTGQKCWCHD